tara:strand:+ start:656 stop:1009 length:354 start_codon:yes stop_codon:yes gene_type:complete
MEQHQVIENIKMWMSLEDNIKLLSKKVSELKKQKKQLSDGLMDVMKNNEIDEFDCNSGKISYKRREVKKSLNKKDLMEILNNYYKGNSIEAERCSNYVMENRKTEIKESLQFTKNKV